MCSSLTATIKLLRFAHLPNQIFGARRTTIYNPVLIKDDAPFLYYSLQNNQDYTIEAHFTLNAASQFDQAGVLIRASAQHWVKAGIEVVDNIPRLSCVVTNGYSDWSTQPWASGTLLAVGESDDAYQPNVLVVPECRIRVHCLKSDSVVVEAWIGEKWEFVRIAHLSVNVQTSPDPLEHVKEPEQSPQPMAPSYWAGIFAACPHVQVACEAKFTFLEITKGSKFNHSAE
jgi:regulation of enolase protein 1 (concanavalin A-like superfamily)